MKREVLVLVWVNGKALTPDISRLVRSLSFTFPKNKGANGKLTILDPNFTLFDNNLFRKGQRLAFLCGWKHELVPVGPFVVKNYGLDCPESGEVALVVDFQDPSHVMNKKQKRKRWVGSPTLILKQIAERHSLGYDIDEVKGIEYTEEYPLIQANMTDAALIQRLAWRYGFIWGVYGSNLIFKSPADLEASGEQSRQEIPVLRYRIGDYSLMSFSPEVKFSKGGKRKSKKADTKNIDLTNPEATLENLQEQFSGMTTEELQENLGDLTGDFDSESVIDNLSAGFTGLSDLFGLEGDQEADDERTDTTDKKVDEIVAYRIKEYEGVLKKYSKKPSKKDEENAETDVGNPSGTASAPNAEEARLKQAGKIVRSAEITTGTIKPTVASMYYRPRMAVVLAGLGKRLSGKYEIKEVNHILSGEGQIFDTEMKGIKRKFGPAPKDKSKINNKVENEPPLPGTEDTSIGQPGPKRSYFVDVYSGDVVRKINGRTDEVVSTVESRRAGIEEGS
jgi:phage protein D